MMTLVTGTDLQLLEHIALGLLTVEPRHGYTLYADYKDTFGAVWGAGRSKFYARLNDLEDEGFLQSSLEPQESRPPRKVYSVTGAGRDALRRWLTQPAEAPRDVRVVVPVKLRLLHMLGWSGAHTLLDVQISALQARLDEEEQHVDDATQTDDERFAELLYELRRRQLQAMIDWLDYCRGWVD